MNSCHRLALAAPPARTRRFLVVGATITLSVLLATLGGCPADPSAVGTGPEAGGVIGDALEPAGTLADNITAEDQFLATFQDTPVTLALGTEGAFGRKLYFSIISSPDFGTVSEIRNNGGDLAELTYTPRAGFVGQDQFRFDVADSAARSRVATVRIAVYSEVRFDVDVLSEQPALTVRAYAFTKSGDDLPNGRYSWNFDDYVEAGPVAKHAVREHSFTASGTHVVTLTLTLAGLAGPISCSYGPDGEIKEARFQLQTQDDSGSGGDGNGVLAVVPSDGLSSSGYQGGPFDPNDKIYTLTNTGGGPLTWTASRAQPWTTLSSTGGTLDPDDFITVTVLINSNADELDVGSDADAATFADTVTFTNVTNGNGNTARPVALTANAVTGALAVTPSDGLNSSGNQGGPFNPNDKIYTLTNTGGRPLTWTASRTQTWTTLSRTGGTLDPDEFITVTVSISSSADELDVGNYADTVTFTNVTNGNGDTGRSVSLNVRTPGGGQCETSNAAWQNFPITAQAGVFTARFDAVPNNDNMTGHTVLSEGPGATYQDYAILIGFGPSGFMDARDGGSYRAETQIPYTAGTAYRFRVEVNVPAHTYSVYVTPEGSGELTLATDFAFRSEQNAVASLDHWGLMAQPGWSHGVCNFVIASDGGMLSVSPSEGLISSGNEGGPFVPASKQYTLNNIGDAPIDWTASKSAAWLDLSLTGGSLDSGAFANVMVSINANANGLSADIYNDTLSFVNDTNGAGNTSRPVSLTVNSTVGVLAVTPSVGLSSYGFEGGPFDPSSITYTLQNVGASAIDYSVAKSAAWLSLNGGHGPLTGSLAPAETFQVAVSINANANSLSANTYPDSVAFANTTNGLGNTGRSVTLNVRKPGSGTPTPVIVASRISGMAPFAVFFEATESTDSNGRKIGDSTGGDGLLGNDLVEYTWDFGPGSENDVGGRYFSGFNAAHVYETPGDYDVLLTVREASGQASLTLRVTAQPFSGTTYYVSAAGNDANNGTSPATAWKTYNKAFGAIRNNSIVQSGDRVLFNRGDVFNYSSGVDLGSARNVLIAAYGAGNRPRIQYTGSTAGHVAISGGANAISIVDIIIHGNNAADLAYGSNNRLFLRILFTNYNQIPLYADLTFIIDSVLTNAIRQNIYYNGSRLVLHSNSIGPVALEHNLYGSVIDRGVITGNHFTSPNVHNLRIGANTGRSGEIVLSENEFDGDGNWLSLHMGASNGGGFTEGAHNILIEKNHFHDTANAIFADNSGYSNIHIRNNLFEIPWTGGGVALSIRYNRANSYHLGIKRLYFSNNTVISALDAPVLTVQTDDHEEIAILNNIILVTSDLPGAYALRIDRPTALDQITSDYNLYHLPNRGNDPLVVRVASESYTLSQWQQRYRKDANSLIADPMFDAQSPFGFGLLPGSPAIDRGKRLLSVPEDLLSLRRPQRGGWDMGALEKQE